MSKTAKVFQTGRSQAVRLPKEFRFDSSEVFIRRQGNQVILSEKPEAWDHFLCLLVLAYFVGRTVTHRWLLELSPILKKSEQVLVTAGGITVLGGTGICSNDEICQYQ